MSPFQLCHRICLRRRPSVMSATTGKMPTESGVFVINSIQCSSTVFLPTLEDFTSIRWLEVEMQWNSFRNSCHVETIVSNIFCQPNPRIKNNHEFLCSSISHARRDERWHKHKQSCSCIFCDVRALLIEESFHFFQRKQTKYFIFVIHAKHSDQCKKRWERTMMWNNYFVLETKQKKNASTTFNGWKLQFIINCVFGCLHSVHTYDPAVFSMFRLEDGGQRNSVLSQTFRHIYAHVKLDCATESTKIFCHVSNCFSFATI